MAATSKVSDQALSVFAFAVYHQLESGEPISAVVRRDGAGHEANAEALKELGQLGLVSVEDDRIAFSSKGQEIIGSLIDAMRQELSKSDRSAV
jgi:ribosomal protein S19E (S16A)